MNTYEIWSEGYMGKAGYILPIRLARGVKGHTFSEAVKKHFNGNIYFNATHLTLNGRRLWANKIDANWKANEKIYIY